MARNGEDVEYKRKRQRVVASSNFEESEFVCRGQIICRRRRGH